MYLFELDSKTYDNQTFPEQVMILGCHNMIFNDCKFPEGVIIHVDRDSSNIEFHRTEANKIQVGYFEEKGILDGLLIDTAKASYFQIFYAGTIKDRHTKNLVWRNLEAYNNPHAAFLPTSADNPIIENNIAIASRGKDTNAFQINDCTHPVLKGNIAGLTKNASKTGDGCGIIIDRWKGNDDNACTDALVENNLCFGNRVGISNYKGRNSVIRKNRCVDNEIGLKFNHYSDYHAYSNDLLNNGIDVKFSNGATDEGYA